MKIGDHVKIMPGKRDGIVRAVFELNKMECFLVADWHPETPRRFSAIHLCVHRDTDEGNIVRHMQLVELDYGEEEETS